MHVCILPSEHFVTARYPLGGIFQFHQATALVRAGHRVGVISPGVLSPRFLLRGYPYQRREQANGFPIFRHYRPLLMPPRMQSASGASDRHRQVGLALYDEYTAAHGRPDVVHAHNALHAGVVAQAIRTHRGTPYVVTEHSSLYATGQIDAATRRAVVSCLGDAAVLTAVSTSLGRDLKRVLAAPALDIHVLQNTLDPLFVPGGDVPARDAQAPFVFLNLASLDANKDQATLIRAFAGGFKGMPARLRIGGEGPLRSTLERLAAELGVEHQVAFLGPLDRLQVRREMQQAGCFVLTSRYETFGVVLVEALACGTPVVATRCGGPEDVVHAGNGLLTDVGDVDGAAAAMQRIMTRRDDYPAPAIRRDCLERFGERAFVAAAVRFYQQAVAG